MKTLKEDLDNLIDEVSSNGDTYTAGQLVAVIFRISQAIKELIEDVIEDWKFCKKANVEPNIHPRRFLLHIKNRMGDFEKKGSDEE